jgi:hypothetical protein
VVGPSQLERLELADASSFLFAICTERARIASCTCWFMMDSRLEACCEVSDTGVNAFELAVAISIMQNYASERRKGELVNIVSMKFMKCRKGNGISAFSFCAFHFQTSVFAFVFWQSKIN